MNTIRDLALVLVLVVAVSVDFQNTLPACVPETVVTTADTDTLWTKEEAVLTCAVIIRSKVLENKTGIKFGKGWVPKVAVRWVLDSNILFQTPAEYKAETGIIYFSVSTMNSLNRKYKTSLSQMDPEIVAEDSDFNILADHELGHALADIVSRRSGADSFYTIAHFYTLPYEQKFGLKVVSEGIGMYFGGINHKMLGDSIGKMAFPGNFNDFGSISGEMIAYQGGYWLVHDALAQYGERGLVWLVSHPFSLGINNMRAAAVEYHDRALKELASP